MRPDPLKGLVMMLLYYISATEGEIRCYCTESGCVTTGYMCKSQLGMCYSLVKYLDESPNPTHSSVVHGCADTLNTEPSLSTCAGHHLNNADDNEGEENVNSTLPKTGSDATEVVLEENMRVESSPLDPAVPRLTCCTQDMCNYKDISNLFTETQPSDVRRGQEGISSERTQEVDKPQKDVWFKAAVIAVPIAGGFILILLVLLAVRMLRTDTRQHRRLIQIRRERSLTKAQLYVTDHFVDKEKQVTPCDNNHSHQLHNHNTKREHSVGHVGGHSHNHNNHSHSHNNPHRNSNSHHHIKHGNPKLTTNRDGYTYEQIVTQNSETTFPNCDFKPTPCVPSTYPSVIVWGQPKSTDPGDVV